MPPEGVNGQIATATSPALECPSHICLLPGADRDARSPAQITSGVSGTGPLCTASCASNLDCVGERADPTNPADHRCRGGFACTVADDGRRLRLSEALRLHRLRGAARGGFKKPAACE